MKSTRAAFTDVPPELAGQARLAVSQLDRRGTAERRAKEAFAGAAIRHLTDGSLNAWVTELKGAIEQHGLRRQRLAPPDRAPELWAERERGRWHRPGYENAVLFVRRVYRQWIEAGVLTNEILHDLDPEAFRAVRLWAERHPDDTIPGLQLRLPSLAERVARLGPDTPHDEIIRLGYALNAERIRIARRNGMAGPPQASAEG